MDSVGDIWDSMYAIPVAGAFILAGAVYYLSFRVKDDDDQSLRTYLNVLSGDDDRNRKAAKRLRKFGTGSPKKVLTTIGSGSFDNDNEDKQADAVQDKEWQQHASVQQQKPVEIVHKVSQLDSEKHADTVSSLNEDETDGTSTQDSELAIQNTEVSSNQGPSGWHKAVSRKEKRHGHNSWESNKSTAEDASNHSVTSEESRLSFKNSSSSRGSSPYRHSLQAVAQPQQQQQQQQQQQRMTHLAVTSSSSSHGTSTTRKFSSRKSLAKPPRPAHLKLETAAAPYNSTRQYRQKSTLNHATVPRPAITLSEATSDELAGANTEFYSDNSEPSFKPSFHNSTLTNVHSVLAPGQSDACIQTEENEDYPSPLEGLRELNAGQPRFVICLDFAMQVDLDVDSSNYDSDIDMRYEDGDKILYSSGGSLSSGDGSTRATPVLEDDSRDFSMTADKYTQGGTSHRTNVYYNRTMPGYYYNEYNQHNGEYTQNSRNMNGKQRGGGGGIPYYHTTPNDTLPRTCRAEKGSADWIDNGSRRGRLVNGRWRN